jgi:Mn-dependent DtxR family transcriptional regulator
MNGSHLIRLVLFHMYTLAQQTEPASVGRLAGDLGLGRHAVAQALLALDRAGLVDCARVRLTLTGLAFAVSARSRAPLALAA